MKSYSNSSDFMIKYIYLVIEYDKSWRTTTTKCFGLHRQSGITNCSNSCSVCLFVFSFSYVLRGERLYIRNILTN